MYERTTMPRKRKTPNNEVAEPNKNVLFPKRTRISSTRSTKSEDAFNAKKCSSWFKEYSLLDGPENIIGPEGIEKFCEDIEVDPENVIMLVIAWKMNAKQMGYFTYEEWMKGLSDLQCDSLQKLKNKMEYLKGLSKEPQVFKIIYRFAFDFARDKQQRSLDIDTAKSMLELLLGNNWKLFCKFRVFLEKSNYKIINKDQWFNILEFSRSINNDLSNYDFDGAWPVMLDEFVEWVKSGMEDE